MIKYYCDTCGKKTSDLIDRYILDIKSVEDYSSWTRPNIHMDICGECYDTLMIIFDKLKEESYRVEESSKETDKIRSIVRDSRAGGRNKS